MEQEEENHREMERCIQTYRPMLMAQASRLTPVSYTHLRAHET